MENFLIRTKETSATSQQTQRGAKATSSSGGFQDSFKEFMKKVGSSAGNGINVAIGNSAIVKVEERPGQALDRSERDYDRNGDYRRQADRADTGGRGERYDYNDRPPAERRDERARDNVSQSDNNAKDKGYGEERTARASDAPDSPRSDPRPGGEREDLSKASADAPAKKPDQENSDKASKDASAKGEKSQDSADKNEASSKKVAKSGSEDTTVVNPAVVANVVVVANDAGKILGTTKKSLLASQLTGNNKGDEKGNIAGQVLGRDISETEVKGKTKKSIAKVGDNNKLGNSNNVATNVGANSNGKETAVVKAADTAKVSANVNSALNDQARAGVGMDAELNSRLAQQAAGISKAVGKGDSLKVSVNVAKESDTLVSRPSLALVSQMPTANNNKQSGNGKSSLPTAKNAVNQASQQIKGGSVQASDQQIKSQASKFQLEVGSQSKGSSQSTAQSGTTSQPVLSGGGETTSIAGPGGAAEPGQARQNTAAKTADARPTSTARQPVLNQVSVQITKAIAAGVDKLSIQLRPRSLGRIEVNLEVAKSGHVSAVVVADNKNTLDMLQNGSDELKQALQNAGLNTDSGSLSFGLREENHTAYGGNGGSGSSVGNGGLGGDEDGAETGSLASRDINIITDSKVDVRA